MRNSTIRGNRAGDGASGASADPRTNGDGGVGGLGGWGGGVYSSGDVTVFDSEITGNSAGAGGRGGNGGSGGSSGIAAGGAGGDGGPGGSGGGLEANTVNGEISQSTVSGNAAGTHGDGGAGGNGTSQGAAGDPGGDGSGAGLNLNGVFFVRNSTISGNQTTLGLGGAIYNGSDLFMNNVTIASNAAARGGGLINIGGQVVVHNSILADNVASSDAPDCLGTINSNGKNLIEDPEGCAGFEEGDLTEVDPQLLPLADNGGPTQTHAITKSSPAYNAAEQAAPGTISGSCLERDQRNKKRTACDIGAYEFVKRRR
jgi:hypothetical protein